MICSRTSLLFQILAAQTWLLGSLLFCMAGKDRQKMQGQILRQYCFNTNRNAKNSQGLFLSQPTESLFYLRCSFCKYLFIAYYISEVRLSNKGHCLMSSWSDSPRDHKDTNEQVFNYQFKMPLGVWTSNATKKTVEGMVKQACFI